MVSLFYLVDLVIVMVMEDMPGILMDTKAIICTAIGGGEDIIMATSVYPIWEVLILGIMLLLILKV